jgi:hypothetical protein
VSEKFHLVGSCWGNRIRLTFLAYRCRKRRPQELLAEKACKEQNEAGVSELPNPRSGRRRLRAAGFTNRNRHSSLFRLSFVIKRSASERRIGECNRGKRDSAISRLIGSSKSFRHNEGGGCNQARLSRRILPSPNVRSASRGHVIECHYYMKLYPTVSFVLDFCCLVQVRQLHAGRLLNLRFNALPSGE